MAHPVPGEHVFSFSGGRLCLDFANTHGGSRAQPKEYLHYYLDLVSWARQAGVLTDREAERLGQVARRRPPAADRMLEEAKALREALFRIFQATVNHRSPAPSDVEMLNDALRVANNHLRLEWRTEPGPAGFEWRWTGDADALDRMLWPVVRSAVELLTSPDLARIHICDSPTCDWLFLDVSRNHSRRWCDMRDCGNRAKARRYYARHKAKA